MSGGETDSLWLQRSITLPDPMPDVTGNTPQVKQVSSSTKAAEHPNTETAKTATTVDPDPTTQPATHQASAKAPHSVPSTPQSAPAAPMAAEMELTKMLLDTSGLVAGGGGGGSVHRPSLSRYSTARASLSSAAFISAHEYDDLRAKFSQAKRELLKVSDIQKDLDFTRFELTRTQEELKLTAQSNQTLRRDLDEARDRADRAVKAKHQLQVERDSDNAAKSKEIDFLKTQIEELRAENSKRIAELVEQQEAEYQSRIESMREEMAAFSADTQSMAAQIEDLRRAAEQHKAAHDDAAQKLAATVKLLRERESDLAEAKQQLKETQESHQRYVDEVAQDREEAVRSQQRLANQRVEQVTRSKDAYADELKDELREVKEKYRVLGEECAVLRNTTQQLREEVAQSVADHAKELRRLAEEHRLAMCEKDLQMESSLREAKSGRTAVEEETQSLRRQLTKVSEELSTVAAVLSQREKQLGEAERENSKLRERLLALEQDNAQLAGDAEMNGAAAEEASERVRRLHEQKDSLEEAYSQDLRSAKDRIRALEASLMESNKELSGLRRQQMTESEDERTALKALREELDAVTSERDRLAHELSGKGEAESTAEEYRKRFSAERQKTEALTAELSAAMGRCATLEKRLDEELRRAISHAVTQTSPSSRQSPAQTAMRLRSVSSVNARLGTVSNGGGSSVKRARTEDARVFAITGFDGNDMLKTIKQLPNVAIAECKSNSPVPSNLTHLITNGQMTIKLLTALVRGCWVLPGRYATESLKQHTWLPECDFGFQHDEPPLLKRRILVTDAFCATKHYSTASLLLREGGAVVVEEGDPEEVDHVLCTSHEQADYETNALTWDKLVEMIYPVRIE